MLNTNTTDELYDYQIYLNNKSLDELKEIKSTINKENFINADKIVMDFENQAILQYRNQAFNYSLFSFYSRFWKQMNKLEGF